MRAREVNALKKLSVPTSEGRQNLTEGPRHLIFFFKAHKLLNLKSQKVADHVSDKKYEKNAFSLGGGQIGPPP